MSGRIFSAIVLTIWCITAGIAFFPVYAMLFSFMALAGDIPGWSERVYIAFIALMTMAILGSPLPILVRQFPTRGALIHAVAWLGFVGYGVAATLVVGFAGIVLAIPIGALVYVALVVRLKASLE